MMQNKVFGLAVVVAKNSSWNSDFDHSPKQYENTFFASDRALKYAVRTVFEQNGKPVLIKKWVKNIIGGKKVEDNSSFEVMNAKELKGWMEKEMGGRFHEIFWTFEDVRHFGMVYDNLNLHGVCQISQGIDVYGQGTVYNDDGTGRMVFESKAKADKETRGMYSREYVTEAHYAYDFSVNPLNVQFLQTIKGYEECVYTEKDYEAFLEGIAVGPSTVASTQKLNCATDFLVTVEMVDGEKTLLSDLKSKVALKPEKVENKVVYDVSELINYLETKEALAGRSIYKQITISYDAFGIILQGAQSDVLTSIVVNEAVQVL
ncbi:type I CRISPR-associated protein Cas7 [Bacillus sp. AFS088145]|uniref:type I CRISPR-associated protein Cas7 n=1 Tax=Bacillus sp. AFS088145 TaxID=2033514 RepID=UPI000BF8D04D|nr:type I CRISPR-associated protein Cas7 [Bacillus sp. AFS088145]PFH91395.1 hypothetical protein COI44_01965 [Bacillus sp. AFS088145]